MPHDHTYKAKVKGNIIRWTEEIPPELDDAKEHDAVVTIAEEKLPQMSEEERKKKMREVLERLVALDPFRDIKDAVQWQREQRAEWDRPWDKQ